MSLDTPTPIYYLTHDELTQLVQRWAAEFPDVVRLRSLAKTLEGRDLWLLEIGAEPDRARPAIWIDGNMHAGELLGSCVALRIAQCVINAHRSAHAGATAPASETLRNTLFYIVPRVSPDGAEEALTSGRLTRSAPRDRRDNNGRPFWRRRDLDGDGWIRQLRMEHPGGEFVCHPQHRHILVPRQVTDAGPYYKVFPEGIVENFAGSVPYPATTSDNDADFNRDFAHVTRERLVNPETQAIIEFTSERPHISIWLNLHTFGGVFIRPPFRNGTALPSLDQVSFDAVAEMFSGPSGMRTICAIDDMTPDKNQPMLGTLASWAYEERGCLAWAVELWDLFGAVGIPTHSPFYSSYGARTHEDIARLAEWDLARNRGRAFAQWTKFDHPQLGIVEIGGLSSLWGFLNPPTDEVERVANGMLEVAVIAANLLPRLSLTASRQRLDGNQHALRLSIVNVGWLPTSVVQPVASRPWSEPIRVSLQVSGCKLVDGAAQVEVGHLPGWGRLRDPDDAGPFFQRSQGIADIGLEWILDGAGSVELNVGSPRLGWQSVRIDLTCRPGEELRPSSPEETG